jgi:hypothetical protein
MLVILLLASCTAALPTIPTSTVTPAPTTTSTPPPPYKMLSPEDMRSDLDELFRQIEKVHPDPYAKRSKEDVNRDRQALYKELDQPLTIVEFYRKLEPLITSLGDNHTRVFPPPDTRDEMYAHERLLPFEIEFEGEQAFITANYTENPDIPLGSELITIDETPLSSILSDAGAYQFLDLGWYLWLLHGSVPEYKIAIVPAGGNIPVELTVPGVTLNEINQQTTEPPVEEVTYNTLPNEKIGILTLNDFISIYEPVKKAFEQIQKDGVQNLIIDIRGNHGGYMESLDLFMNYLTDQPYQKCYKCALNRPWDNVSNRYHGNIYLLIGPYTHSAAVLLANILQDHQLATLIGEETAETSSFCAYVMIGGEPLPRTGLKYMVSSQCYVRPNGIVDGRGVIPDMIVKTKIDDIITGSDPVLDYTLKMIRDGQ